MISTNPPLENSNFEIDLGTYRPDIVEAIIASCSKQNAVPKCDPYCQYKAWSDAETEELLYMFDQGCSMLEMSDKFHRTSGGIRGKLRRLGKLQQPIKLHKDQEGGLRDG